MSSNDHRVLTGRRKRLIDACIEACRKARPKDSETGTVSYGDITVTAEECGDAHPHNTGDYYTDERVRVTIGEQVVLNCLKNTWGNYKKNRVDPPNWQIDQFVPGGWERKLERLLEKKK